MFKKPMYLTVLLLILASTVGITLRVPSVEASTTVYIRADGSIEGTTNIVTVDKVTYTFTGNISDEIVIERDNIVVDGAGFTVQGTGAFGSHGIDLISRTGVTIKNVEIKKFKNGITLEHSNESSLLGNNLTNNDFGIVLFFASNNTISGNRIMNSNSDGIYLQYSVNNSLTANDVVNNAGYGVVLDESANNTLYDNWFIENTQHVSVSPGYTNVWYDASSSRGNYWSDYEDRYPNATQISESGIWDTPYVIDADNVDSYPLIPEFASFLLLPLFIITTILAGIVCRRKGTRSVVANN